MNQPPPPFTCSYSPNMPELLSQLNCTLALSTYQAGKVVFFSATGPESMIQLPRSFKSPMGMACDGDRLAVATKQEVVVLANSPELARTFPTKPGVYDGLFVPRAVYYTGELDLHDMAWGGEGLWAVNTRFSCLCLIDDRYSFRPRWRPQFIQESTPDDQCHLNGMAMLEGRPEYVTALGISSVGRGWRENLAKGGGILMHVPSGDIIFEGLHMPHSPRLYGDKLYFVQSGTGELMEADPKARKMRVINKVQGFARGMARLGDFLFVGLSRLRQKSSTFKDLPIAKEALFSGIMVLDLRLGSIIGWIKYENSVEEIYDVQVLSGLVRPNILNHETPEHRAALATPRETFWGVVPGQEPPQAP